MTDIKLVWNNETGEGDFQFSESDNDLTQESGLETAVVVSLFCNARAADDDVLPDKFRSTDPGGFWGDDTSEKDNDSVGSKLWLLNRAKTTQEVLDKAKQYAEEALRWLVDEGIAAKIVVATSRGGSLSGALRIDLSVQIYRKDGEVTALEFESAWEAMFN